MKSTKLPLEIPILPISNRVLFPGGLIRLSLGQASSVKMVQNAIWEMNRSKKKPIYIGIFTRARHEDKEGGNENKISARVNVSLCPFASEIYEIGTLGRVVQLSAASGNQSFQYSMLVEGITRVCIDELMQNDPYMIATVKVLKEIGSADDPEIRTLALNLQKAGRGLLDTVKTRQVHVLSKVRDAVDDLVKFSPGDVADVFVSNLDITVIEKQAVLSTVDLKDRLSLALELVQSQLEITQISSKIDNQIQGKLSEARKEYYLRQQLKAIREELGENVDDDDGDDLSTLSSALEAANLPVEVRKVANRELKRLKTMSPSLPEYNVCRTYLDCIANLPWNVESKDCLDVQRVSDQLNSDHYGLDLVKKRIAEYIAVRNLKADMKGPILCLVGPPGVGKTSLGKSVATATGRNFKRISLGGVRDEAVIRGHRRTYVGAIPGNIISALKRAGTKNPVLLLDEIDKLGNDIRGDPASALLEVLDPSQNHSFTDHYLDLPFDLSNVMFIATANSLDSIPLPLLDRMEVIEVPGYIMEEKVAIAERYLLPRQLNENGLSGSELEMPKDTIEHLISKYTREAGVRNLERHIGAVCRHVAVQLVDWKKQNVGDKLNAADSSEMKDEVKEFSKKIIKPSYLSKILGEARYFSETALRTGVPGVATGMAWTSVGGELLFIEASRMDGSGKINLTGKLGDVMKESVHLALSWIRGNAPALQLTFKETPGLVTQSILAHDDKHDIHIHFPAGAIPKDGPSAGVAIVVAVISLLTGKAVSPDFAMTGEITLRGIVLPVGGIKEKVLAAHRGGVRKVILPARNEKDTKDLPKSVLRDIDFIYVTTIMDALNAIFGLTPDSPHHIPISEENMASTPVVCSQANLDAAGPMLQSYL